MSSMNSVLTKTHLDDDNGASANLAWLAFFVDFAQTAPFAQFLVGINADQWNLVLVAQSCDQFLVCRLIAAFGQDGKDSLTPAKQSLIETALSTNTHTP